MDRVIYYAMIIIAVAGLILALGQGAWWTTYYGIYLAVAVLHTWYTYIFLAKEDLFPRKYPTYDGGPIAVLVPTYNEDPELFERMLVSAIKAEGNKNIYVVDDGSKNRAAIMAVVARYKNRNMHYHCFARNKGKRAALHHAITRMRRDEQYVISMDSDTVMDPHALVRMTEPLMSPKIGAVAGYLDVLNRNENWLSRLTETYYWIAFNIARKSQSALGQVNCCSGALAAYKREVLDAVIQELSIISSSGQSAPMAKTATSLIWY